MTTDYLNKVPAPASYKPAQTMQYYPAPRGLSGKN